MRRSIVVFAAFVMVGLAGCSVAASSGSSQPGTTAGTTAKGTHPKPGAKATTQSTRSDTTLGSTSTDKDKPAHKSSGKAEERSHTGVYAKLVMAISDSAMLGAVDPLEQKIPNLILLDGQGSRQAPAAIDLLKQYRADGHLAGTVIVHIGNNGYFTAQEFDEMMAVLSGVRKVLVVNLSVPPDVADPVAVPNDAVLAAGVRRYPKKAFLVDWYSASVHHPEYFWDGIHLTPEGAQAYAALISSYVGHPKGSIRLPAPRKRFYWGRDGFAGECVGPSSWCLGIVRQ
jgi:hypothetical protein